MDLSSIFDAGFERVVQKQGSIFFDTFYDVFTSKSPEIKAAFANTNMERQKLMLKDSLMHLVAFSLSQQVTSPLEKIATVHANLQIGVELYDIWMDSLIESLSMVDTHYTNKDAMAWRVILSHGVEYMKSHMRPQIAADD